MSKPILYTYFRSSCSWRVRIALAHKGIDYESKFVNLLKSEQNSEDQIKLNPKGEIPIFIIDDHILTQSIPIIEFLDETFPEKPLLPKDRFDRAKVREISEIIASGIQPFQNTSALFKRSEVESERIEWAKYWISKGFEALEQILLKTSGIYCFGDEVTLADCCLVPQMYGAGRFRVDLNNFPTIVRVNSALEKLEAFKVSHALAQPDCPAELRP